MLAGLVHSRVNASEIHNGAAARKAAHIANLCHELRPKDRANAKHPHHDRVLWKLSSQSEHLVLDHGNRFYDCVELRNRKSNKAFNRVGHRKRIYL